MLGSPYNHSRSPLPPSSWWVSRFAVLTSLAGSLTEHHVYHSPVRKHPHSDHHLGGFHSTGAHVLLPVCSGYPWTWLWPQVVPKIVSIFSSGDKPSALMLVSTLQILILSMQPQLWRRGCCWPWLLTTMWPHTSSDAGNECDHAIKSYYADGSLGWMVSHLSFCGSNVVLHSMWAHGCGQVGLCANPRPSSLYNLIVSSIIVGSDVVFIATSYILILRQFLISQKECSVESIKHMAPMWGLWLCTTTWDGISLCGLAREGHSAFEHPSAVSWLYLIIPSALDMSYGLRTKQIGIEHGAWWCCFFNWVHEHFVELLKIPANLKAVLEFCGCV